MKNTICCKCKLITDTTSTEIFAYDVYQLCKKCEKEFFELIENFIQPERSKREDSHKCEMRCSEHCGNTVRDK